MRMGLVARHAELAMDTSFQGHFLIASPTLGDPNFFRTVVLIIQHDESGALGLVINHPLHTTVGETWNRISDIPYENDAPLYLGGPCESPLMVLHCLEEAGKIEVLPGIYFTAEADDLNELVRDQSSPVKFFAGSAGWTNGQLETEVSDGDWLVMPSLADQRFSRVEDQWRVLTRLIARLAAVPDLNPKLIPPDPSVN